MKYAHVLKPASPCRGSSLKRCLSWLGVLASVRIGMVLVLAVLTQQQQFTDDWQFMLSFYEHPLQILLVEERGGMPFWPPFYPLVSALFGWPLSTVLPAFFSVRLVSIIFELLAWPIIWLIIIRLTENPRTQNLIALGYVFMPIAWATTVIYGQDESVAMLVLVGIALLVLDKRYRLAALLCGVGAIAAKIYFLVPLLAVTVALPVVSWREYLHRAILGGLPVVLAYGWVAYAQINADTLLPKWRGATGVALLDFESSSKHGVSLAALVLKHTSFSLDTVRVASFFFALGLPLVLLLTLKLKRVQVEQRTAIQLIVAMLLIVFLWFYHCDPEYYLMIAPLLWVTLPPAMAFLLGFLGLSLPYFANLGYGVANFQARGGRGGKAIFVELYQRFVPISPDLFHTLALIAVAIVNCTIVVLLIRAMLRNGVNRPSPQARGGK